MQYDSAAVHFNAALAVDPNMDRSLQHLTWTYMRLDRKDDALKTSERWVQAAPSAEAYEYLAMAHYQRDDLTRATQILEAVRKRYPDSPRIPLRIATMQFSAGKPYEALKTLDVAEGMAEENEEFSTLYEIGAQRAMVIYPYLGRYRDAFAELDKGQDMLKKSLDDSTYVTGGAMARASLQYWAYQDPKRSLETLNTLAGASAKRLGPEYQRAVAAYSILSGDTARANAIIRDSKDKLTPAHIALLKMFEAAYQGDCTRAQAMARDLPAQKGYNSNAKPSVEYILASCALESGDYTGAITRLRKLVDTPTLDSDMATIYAMTWLKLGKAYEGKGEVASALTSYQRVLDMLRKGDSNLASLREARERLDRLAAAGAM
jgi:tetratricopeptide (TPR) repeat protein